MFDYSTKNYQNIGNYYTFFNVPSVCSGIDDCVIKEQGCMNEYTGDKLKLIKSIWIKMYEWEVLFVSLFNKFIYSINYFSSFD